MNSSILMSTDTSYPDSPARRQALQKLFARIGEISSLPTTAQKIFDLANDDQASPDELRNAIQADPALVTRILRRVNSSYYGLRNRVGDLRTAIGLLGFREIHNLAITAFMARMFDGPGTYGRYNRQGLWMHSMGVALTSRLLSNVTGLCNPEEAYVAGLLHDLGYILLDQNLRRHFWRILDELEPSLPTYVVERRVLTFDHAQLGGYVAQQWRFPDAIAEAIAHHHEPHRYHGKHKELVAMVAVANHLCTAYDWTALGVANVPPPHERIFSLLGLDDTALAIIQEELPETLEKANVMAAT